MARLIATSSSAMSLARIQAASARRFGSAGAIAARASASAQRRLTAVGRVASSRSWAAARLASEGSASIASAMP